MRRFYILLSALLLSLSIASAQDVRYLTTAEFRQQVFDYTKDSVWHYQGTMEELSEQFCDSVIFYKVDTERERELAYYFQITSIPMILFVPTNDMPQMAKGLLPKETLTEAIRKVLLKKK